MRQKEEIAVRVNRERWKKALIAHGTTEVQLAKDIGQHRSVFYNWADRRRGFPQNIVDALADAGIQAHEYDDTQTAEPKDIEDAFVRALERFYGVKEGEYTQWFITTMNAITKNACREVIHGSEIPKIQRHSERPGEDLQAVARRGGGAGRDHAADILQAPGFPQGYDAQRTASGE